MTFNEWLKKRQLVEVGTSTGDVAGFARPVFGGPIKTRMCPDIADTEFKKDKKKKKKD